LSNIYGRRPTANTAHARSLTVDDWDALGLGMKIDRRATDWGLVSFGIGGCFLVMAPVMLTFNVIYWTQGFHHHGFQFEIDIARVATVVVGGAFVALIVFGLIAGFKAWGLSRAGSHSIALPLAGVLTCGLDVLLWLALGIHLLAILNTFA
jgi:hypothetical protein